MHKSKLLENVFFDYQSEQICSYNSLIYSVNKRSFRENIIRSKRKISHLFPEGKKRKNREKERKEI